MIAFVTLFLGLMHGVRPVEVTVGETVASVAYDLDGRRLGRLARPPWEMDVDFGGEFLPHELVVRAFDGRGDEVGLVRQWVNLPRPPAEVDAVLLRGGDGRVAAARWTWESILGVPPKRITMTFDRKPLRLTEERVTALPAYDPQTTHVLTAVLDYPDGIRSRRDLVLGGGSSGDAQSELTAVPVAVSEGVAPGSQDLAGRFRRGDQTLSIAAVEHGPAEVVLVRDLSPREAARALRASFLSFADKTVLASDDVARILWPVAKRIESNGYVNELFDVSRDFTGRNASLRFLLTQVSYPSESLPVPRMADAVAVAGLRAYGSYTRRAVVLVLGSDPRDQSRYDVALVRRYLERLRVPLLVWSLAPPAAAPASSWGEAEDVSNLPALDAAVERLRRRLDRQFVVWLEGRHLPQDIAVVMGGEGPGLATP